MEVTTGGITMRNSAKFGLAIFGICWFSAAYALTNGILIGSTIEVWTTRDAQANRIINTSIGLCRYLHVWGVVQHKIGDVELVSCSRFGPN
jgi:hypothetical protein